MMHNLARLLTVKAAAVAVALTATGGVALAAGTGALPVPGGVGGSGTVTGSTSDPTPAPSGKAASGHVGRVDWTELCRAATAGHAADSAAFTRLVTAAGGAAQLPAFCAGVLGGDSAAPVSGSATVVLPTTPRGKHLGWCKGVGNPHHTAAQCGTGTTAGPVAGINVNGSGKTPPGWCNPHNPHYTAAGCPDATVGGGADTTDDEAGDNGND